MTIYLRTLLSIDDLAASRRAILVDHIPHSPSAHMTGYTTEAGANP